MTRTQTAASVLAALLIAATIARFSLSLGPDGTESHQAAPDYGAALPPDPLPPLADLRAVIDRSVFSPTRQGVRIDSPLGQAAATGAGLELVGVVMSGTRKAAQFRLPDGTSKAVALNQTVAGWSLGSVEKDRVTLTRDAKTITVVMSRAPRPGPDPSAPRPLD